MFISFEGTEGVGKSTLIARVQAHLIAQNKVVCLTREPGGTPLAETLRAVLLDAKQQEPIAADTELLLMYAARSQHLAQVIEPALNAGQWVLSDRFCDASFAYQGYGRGLTLAKISALNDAFVTRMPDLTFWLDAPIELGMARAQARGELDRFEQEKLAFFSKVRAGYAELQRLYPERIKRIDATQNADAVFEQAVSYLIGF